MDYLALTVLRVLKDQSVQKDLKDQQVLMAPTQRSQDQRDQRDRKDLQVQTQQFQDLQDQKVQRDPKDQQALMDYLALMALQDRKDQSDL